MARGESMIVGRKFGSEVFGRGGRGGGERGRGGMKEGDVDDVEDFLGDLGSLKVGVHLVSRSAMMLEVDSDDVMDSISTRCTSSEGDGPSPTHD